MKQEKTFTSGISWQTVVLALIPLIIGIVLIRQGIRGLSFFVDTDRYVFVILPLAVGIIIELMIITVFISNMGQSITVTPDEIIYRKGKYKMSAQWYDLVYKPPHYSSRFMRSFVISSGKDIVRIEEIFFPKFCTLNEIIKAAKASKKGEMRL